MTLPVYPNSISLQDLITEFGVTDPTVDLDDFYAGGTWVAAGTVGFPLGGSATAIPASGTITLGDFHGAAGKAVYNIETRRIGALYQNQQFLAPGRTWYIYVRGVGGGGGAGGLQPTNLGAILGGSGGSGGSFLAKFVITPTGQGGTIVLGQGYGGGGGHQGQYISPPQAGTIGSLGGRGSGRSWVPAPVLHTVNSVTTQLEDWRQKNWSRPLNGTASTDIDLTFKQGAVWPNEMPANFNNWGSSTFPVFTVFFPTTAQYVFTGSILGSGSAYIDSPDTKIMDITNYLPGQVYTSATRTVTAGWHHIIFTGGTPAVGQRRGLYFRIATTGGSTMFDSKDYVKGGLSSGGYYVQNAGFGGTYYASQYQATTFPNSPIGAAGGGSGGGASAVMYFETTANAVPFTNNFTYLALAPGGGGGGGPSWQYLMNANPNFAVNRLAKSTLLSSVILNPTNTDLNSSNFWDNFASGNREPYNLARSMEGHGYNSLTDFFPTNSNQFFNLWQNTSYGTGFTSPGALLGGAGGGGGAPWGLAGGHAEFSGNLWNIPLSYTSGQIGLPYASNGGGGDQGYFYYDPVYTSSFTSAVDNSLFSSYGSGGISSQSSTGDGVDGFIRARISSEDDGIYPSGLA